MRFYDGTRLQNLLCISFPARPGHSKTKKYNYVRTVINILESILANVSASLKQ